MALTTNKTFVRTIKADDATFVNATGEPRVNIEGGVQLYNSDGDPIDSLGSSGAGGGSIVYTNASGDFTAVANDGTKTITITGLPFTLEDINVVAGSIKKIAADGTVSTVDSDSVTVAAGVITLLDADDFVATDTVSVTLVGPDKAYDRSLDTSKNTVQNPEWAKYTDVEHIVDTDTLSTDQEHYSPEIFMDGYRFAALQFTANASIDTGVNFRIFATLNSSAATPADEAAVSADWVDTSSEILGSAPLNLGAAATESGIYFIDTETMPYKFIVQYTPTDGTNTCDIFLRRYS